MSMNPRLLRPRATGFTPKSIAGLALWLDASQPSSITLNSGNVSQWRDLSGNGRHATQETALNQPAYNTNPLNGRGTINFTTSSSLSGSYVAVTDHSLFVVCRFGSGSNSVGRLFTLAAAATNDITAPPFIPILRGNPSLEQIQTFVAGSFVAGRAITYNDWFIASSIYSGTTVSNRVNGGSENTGTGSISGNAYARYGIGTGFGGTAPAIVGDVAEYIAFSRAISSTERIAIQSYLSRKWGVAVA